MPAIGGPAGIFSTICLSSLVRGENISYNVVMQELTAFSIVLVATAGFFIISEAVFKRRTSVVSAYELKDTDGLGTVLPFNVRENDIVVAVGGCGSCMKDVVHLNEQQLAKATQIILVEASSTTMFKGLPKKYRVYLDPSNTLHVKLKAFQTPRAYLVGPNGGVKCASSRPIVADFSGCAP